MDTRRLHACRQRASRIARLRDNLQHNSRSASPARIRLASKGGRRWVPQCSGEAISAIRDWSVTEGKESRGAHAGRRVRQSGVQRRGAAEAPADSRSITRLRRTITHGDALDPSVADAVAAAMKDWAVEHGATHYTHWFQPLTGITAEKHDSFLIAERRRQGGPGVLGQGADQGRARRLELPVRRHALHLRGARLHGVGSDQPALAALQRRRGHAGDPDGVRELDRRNARQEDAAAALDGSALQAGGARAEAVRLDGRARRSRPAAPSRNIS